MSISLCLNELPDFIAHDKVDTILQPTPFIYQLLRSTVGNLNVLSLWVVSVLLLMIDPSTNKSRPESKDWGLGNWKAFPGPSKMNDCSGSQLPRSGDEFQSSASWWSRVRPVTSRNNSILPSTLSKNSIYSRGSWTERERETCLVNIWLSRQLGRGK